MKVYGVKITEEEQQSTVSWMKTAPFSTKQLEAYLLAAGIPRAVPNTPLHPWDADVYRLMIANRTIAKQKKAKNLMRLRHNATWSWIGNEPRTD